MKRPNITPGFWEARGSFNDIVATTPDLTIACVNRGNPALDSLANAQAIAAVPDLLEALELARDLIAVARSRFPKSVKHRDTYKLCLADAVIGSALAKAGYTF